MRFSSLAALAALTTSALAEDLLFVENLTGLEIDEAATLGFSTKTVTETEWRAMTTTDFASFKAIIIGDDFGSSDLTLIQFLADTKDVWGPAVTGNIVVHGADQSNHDKTVLIDNSIKFAVSSKSLSGQQQTGLYFSLSQYYDQIAVSNVDALAYFGTFEVRGQLNCYDNVHIVATSPAIDTLTDDYLSNWGCSVHEAFSAYPSAGINGFQALAIADGVVAPGTQNYGDGHSGLPYIISRGATPAGCGDGHWDPSIGEECDDGNTIDGDGCSHSCKCESGKPKGDGTCLPANSTVSTTPSKPSGKPTGYSNSTVSVSVSKSAGGSVPPYPITTSKASPTSIPPYITPSLPTSTCIGIEIIIYMTVIETCSTIAPGNTVTYTTTSACSTYQMPIYNTPIPSMPCYVCAMSSCGINTNSGWITATTTHCPSCQTTKPATVYPCSTCEGITLTETCPWQVTPTGYGFPYTTYAPHTEHQACTTCSGYGTTVNPVATAPPSTIVIQTSTGTGVPLKPSTSVGAIQFTGAAARPTGLTGAVGAVVGAGALAVLAL